VGCVIARSGRVVGEGFHRRAGEPHAEVLALARAGARARGATLYVNLEPCSHHGRTPPCAPAVVAAGVSRVVVGARDPDPRVRGRGLALLRRAGVEIESGVLAAEARLLNERHLTAARLDRPFVLLKVAQTLDGRIATARGDSRWITNPEQRRAARRLRRLHDGLLVGIGTVLADDPLLLPEPPVRRPFLRLVADSGLRLPADCRLARSTERGAVVVLTTRAAARAHSRRALRLSRAGVLVLAGPSAAGRVSLPWALRALRERGVRSLMVEGGSELLGSFLRQRRFDQVAIFRAPLLLGGRGSRPAFGGANPRRIAEAVRLTGRSPLLRGLAAAGPSSAAPGAPDALFEVWYPDRRGRR
jgi:diaminohydroxyphosphoribosylaminopyrimidine deaminase/5-amino-6-(5-phosphoribosylamino)uracil reductase